VRGGGPVGGSCLLEACIPSIKCLVETQTLVLQSPVTDSVWLPPGFQQPLAEPAAKTRLQSRLDSADLLVLLGEFVGGFCHLFLLEPVEVPFDDLFDAVGAEFGGDAEADALVTVLAVEDD